MLTKDDEIITKLKQESLRGNKFDTVNCWIKKEGTYNLYVFSVFLSNEEELSSNWLFITTEIASNFQMELKWDVERFNIYIVFIVREKVSENIKHEIKQNKVSSRKIIIDGVVGAISEEDIKELIFEKLFSLNIEKNLENDGEILSDILKSNNPKLYETVVQKFDDKKVSELLQMYLEVLQ
ncbi:hypothetical protein CN912_11975 [Bacillus cereus]|uniref:ABC-three component system middle component 1 n=1 Tax=Bacillus cereus group TaxID=86661 RepID=UPI000BF096BA|nr:MULTISPECIES: ABC-three component system middle component 1 [Bacillus cereus group]PEL43856.1 hypothetical protein CN607_05370 [Bacillus wiedmannii]PGL11848.1 hypothetical protein CN912_11975 [Bacillus cereus]